MDSTMQMVVNETPNIKKNYFDYRVVTYMKLW